MNLQNITRHFLLKEAFDDFEDNDSIAAGNIVYINEDESILSEMGVDVTEIRQSTLDYFPDSDASVVDMIRDTSSHYFEFRNAYDLDNGTTIAIADDMEDLCDYVGDILGELKKNEDEEDRYNFRDICDKLPTMPDNQIEDTYAVQNFAESMSEGDNPSDAGWEYDDATGRYVNPEDPEMSEDDYYDECYRNYLENWRDFIEDDDLIYYYEPYKISEWLKDNKISEQKILNALNVENIVESRKLPSGCYAVLVKLKR